MFNVAHETKIKPQNETTCKIQSCCKTIHYNLAYYVTLNLQSTQNLESTQSFSNFKTI